MEIKSTYTVGHQTFETEQEAIDYVYFCDRKQSVMELFKDIFPERTHIHANQYSPETIAEKLVENPELLRQAHDIIEGK